MDHLSSKLGMDPGAFREANFYAEGDRTHFGQVGVWVMRQVGSGSMSLSEVRHSGSGGAWISGLLAEA